MSNGRRLRRLVRALHPRMKHNVKHCRCDACAKRRRDYSTSWREQHRAEIRASDTARRASRPGYKPRQTKGPLPVSIPREQRHRASQMRARYGLAFDRYTDLLRLQSGCCAICRRSFFDGPKLKDCIDHDHSTGVVRGILCDDCNVGLGRFRDDPQLLLAAHDYVTRGAR